MQAYDEKGKLLCVQCRRYAAPGRKRCEGCRQGEMRRYYEDVARNICVRCRKVTVEAGRMCTPCRMRASQANKKSYRKHSKKIMERQKKRIEERSAEKLLEAVTREIEKSEGPRK